MRLPRATALACLVFLWFALGVGTTLATEEPTTESPATESPTTTVETDIPPDPNAPPVVVEPEIEKPEADPWTARFVAPLMAVLGVVIFIVVVVYYVLRIRGRYEVVG
jgi:uncharacterized protein HemX